MKMCAGRYRKLRMFALRLIASETRSHVVVVIGVIDTPHPCSWRHAVSIASAGASVEDLLVGCVRL